ncbi:hypothetical protein PGTUg99_005174 [Puccinia graminis f. sp. tritici]|uniref:Uncharacterized protein n=1 Tax=Puccinia graminis f. sp. tritici TaxID=56615 RepID=A0A5B0MIZ5_PUCGR|nr:hypothetical protein PGTUg99_005174 [Puccinia graminis f. sp. tritici]
MPSTPRTPRRTRTRTRTRTRRPIAYSSQHIIAVATNNRTIQLRFIPNPNRPTPANEYQLSKQEEHPLRIEELLFSPDGTQLLIISISPARLRLSILNQSPDKADQWNLAWDYLIGTKQPTKISAATFINQTRRSFVEPVYENQQTQNPIEIGSNKYHPLRRTTASAINSFAHGKGQTAILVFNTNQVFNRVGHRKLLIDKESSSSSTEPIEHRSSSLIRVCKLIPQWRVREGCFLVFVEKRKRPIGLFKAADPLEGSEGVDDDDEQGEGEGDEGVEYECWVLDGHDLSTLAVKALPRLDQGELEQVSLSYHGIWACTLDQHGKVRASPLVSLDQPATIIGLIISALHNREPVDDISRLLATPSTSAIESTPTSTERSPSNGVVATHHPIFRDIGLFITHLYPPCRGFDFDPYLASSWSLSYDLWRIGVADDWSFAMVFEAHSEDHWFDRSR